MNRSEFLARVAADRHRPAYHFVPPGNWMNDPNGPIQFEGRYHLFYQFNPYDATWGGHDGVALYEPVGGRQSSERGPGGTMHWGHAVSADLATWAHLPVALAPTPGGPDKDGCFSGCAVVHEGLPTLLYTGVHPEVQLLAVSRDGLRTWEKRSKPILAGPPEGWTRTDFRDPCVWREGETWRMLIGTGIKEVGGTALLYRSADLLHWEALGALCIGDKVHTGEIWECPDFFPAGDPPSDLWALLVSPIPTGRTLWMTGRYAADRFAPERDGTVDYGDYYAAKSFKAEDGRRILWGWVREGRPDAAQRLAGWSGAMSLPRVVTVDSDGSLCQEPAPELHRLRGEHRHAADVSLTGKVDLLEFGVNAPDTLELLVRLLPGTARAVGLFLRRAPDGSEETRLVYDVGARTLCIVRERSSLDPETARTAQGGSLVLAAGEPLTLHLFLDRSVLEVYANGRLCITSRIYPTRADSLGLSFFADGGSALLVQADAWTIDKA